MANDLARNKEESRGTICPLFAECEEPLYSDEISKIRICRLGDKNSMNRNGKIPLRKEDYYVDEDPKNIFKINPYTTTEEDLQEQFGEGEFFIDALRKPDGKVMPGGHRLVFQGPDGSDEEEEEEKAKPAQPESIVPREMLDLFHKTLEMQSASSQQRENLIRETSKSQAEMQSTFATTLMKMATDDKGKGSDYNVLIRMLQGEVEEIRKKAARDEEDLRRQHRVDIEKREREVEDLRRDHREQLAKRDREVDEIRSRASKEDDDARRRWRDDVTDLRTKYEREIAQSRAESGEIRLKLQTELDQTKSRLDQRVYQLEKENIKLEKDLAIARTEQRAAESAQETAEEALQAAAKASSKDGTPWWLPLIQTEAGQKIVGGLVSNFMRENPNAQIPGMAPPPQEPMPQPMPMEPMANEQPQTFYPPTSGYPPAGPMPPPGTPNYPQAPMAYAPVPAPMLTPRPYPVPMPAPAPSAPVAPQLPNASRAAGGSEEPKPVFVMPQPPPPVAEPDRPVFVMPRAAEPTHFPETTNAVSNG